VDPVSVGVDFVDFFEHIGEEGLGGGEVRAVHEEAVVLQDGFVGGGPRFVDEFFGDGLGVP